VKITCSVVFRQKNACGVIFLPPFFCLKKSSAIAASALPLTKSTPLDGRFLATRFLKCIILNRPQDSRIAVSPYRFQEFAVHQGIAIAGKQ